MTTQGNGCIYICGGAGGFGPAVVAALRGIFAEQGGLSDEAAAAYLAGLLASGRYMEDLSD